MFCNKCGKEVVTGSKFCNFCGAVVENNQPVHKKDNTSVVPTEKIGDIDTLILTFKNIDNSIDKGTALSHAVTAQLQLLKAIDSKTLSLNLFNLMIESLYQALKISNDEGQNEFLQHKASLMVSSFISFKEAKWRFDTKKDKDEAEKTLQQACEMLAETAGAIAAAYTGNVGLLKISVQEVVKSLTKEKGFFGKFLDIITGKADEKAMKKKDEHYSFLESAFEKLYKYRALFGKSSVLAELASDYKDEIIGWRLPFPPEYTSGIGGISLGIGISELVSFLVIAIMALINLIPTVDWSKGITIMWYVIGGLLALGLFAIIIRLIAGGIQKIVYNNKCRRVMKEVGKEFGLIIKAFDIV
ncbi:hypothetical protein FACS189450_14150 [Spirochaetia bacterium]|nr:hypothetical protein FACS189450_14150 [Spirochaetia bacterium]